MEGKQKNIYIFGTLALSFLVIYNLPVAHFPFSGPLMEAFLLLRMYAREHVLMCLIPAFFIAGGISVFVSKESVLKYFGRNSRKILSYGVASISGSILAVCSCTVLPIFSSIYKRGAGLGPATTFLYSGPAINILAILLTARVLGWKIGLARAIGAVIFSIIIGLLMHFIFLKEEKNKENGDIIISEDDDERDLLRNGIYFLSMVGILIFANLPEPNAGTGKAWTLLYTNRWVVTGIFFLLLLYTLKEWFKKSELKEWLNSTWNFTKQILPLLFAGVFIAGILLGRPSQEGIIPSHFINSFVGGNSLSSNFFASIIGAFMYFATLTEIPIVQGLIGSGMGKGPALALLLAGPALSLPNMLVIRNVLGNKKTLVYIVIVVIMATLSGIIFGRFV